MKNIFKYTLPTVAIALALGMTSCTKDLDVTPLDPNMDTEYSAEGLFNKCYATIAMAGNGGANGLSAHGATMVSNSLVSTPMMSHIPCSMVISLVSPLASPIVTSI